MRYCNASRIRATRKSVRRSPAIAACAPATCRSSMRSKKRQKESRMAKFIGSRTRSKEGPRHVTGKGLFTDDFTMPGMLQAMILRSPHAHAKILSVDPSEALEQTNVFAVVTPDDVKKLTKPFKPGRYAAGLKQPIDEYAGAVDKVRYVGEPIRALAAKDRGSPEHALELIQVDYEPLRANVDVHEAIKPPSAVLFDELGTNLDWTG